MTGQDSARESARDLLNQAATHYERGEYDKALEWCAKGVEADPSFADGLHFQGIVQLARGELGEAEQWIRRALELDSERMEFLQNLAVVLMDRSALPEAVEILRRVYQAEPENAEALELLGRASFLAGSFADAADAYARLIGLAPDNARARHNFTLALREAPLTTYSEDNERLIIGCMQLPDIDHLHLTPSVVGQLLHKYGLAEDADGTLPELSVLGRDPLLLNAFATAYLADSRLEDALIDARQQLLETRSLDDDTRRLACGLGIYGLHTGFAWPISESESQRCADLRRELYVVASGEPTAPIAQDAAIRLAMYAPLAAIPEAATISRTGPDQWPESARELLLRSLHLAYRRKEAASNITPLVAGAIQSVRAPGPHWRSMPPRTPTPFREVLAARLPALDITALPDRRPLRVLVAGAGTGRHASNIAALYVDAEVLAVDQNTDDLAFAMQKSEEFELRNLRFRYGSLADLGRLEEGFDVVEAPSGEVTPQEWGALRGMLDSGGILHVSTAMDCGRQALAKLVDELQVDTADDASVRGARRRILAGAGGATGEMLAQALEFYTLSGARALLTPVSGASFSDLWQSVEAGRYEFLGFSPVPARLAAFYRSEFPDEPTGRRLENWVALEQRDPDRVAGLLGFARLGVWLRVLA